MSNEDITHLYKYRSAADRSWEYLQKALTLNEMYFPKPSDFNDPFDCFPVISIDGPQRKQLDYLERIYRRHCPSAPRPERRQAARKSLRNYKKNPHAIRDLRTLFAELTDQVGVLSLSENPSNILMWGHYSDAHRGVCLRFKAEGDTPFFGAAQPVNYQRERPVVNLVMDSHYEQADKALLTKSDSWRYEREWRIVHHENGPGVYRFPNATLDGVILGARMDSTRRQQVIELAQNRESPCQIFDASISQREFGLDFVEL